MALHATNDERLKKSADAGRENASSEDVRRLDNDGTGTTVSERRQMFQEMSGLKRLYPTPPGNSRFSTYVG